MSRIIVLFNLKRKDIVFKGELFIFAVAFR